MERVILHELPGCGGWDEPAARTELGPRPHPSGVWQRPTLPPALATPAAMPLFADYAWA